MTLKKYEMYLLPFTSRVPRGCADIKGFSLFFPFSLLLFCFVCSFVCLFFWGGGCATVFAEKERPFVVYALPLSKRTTRWTKSCHVCCVTKTRQRVQRIKFHWQTKVVSFPPDMVEDKIEI